MFRPFINIAHLTFIYKQLLIAYFPLPQFLATAIYSTDNIKQICYGKHLKISRINATVSSNHLPKTTAYVRITQQSWQQGQMEGEVRAAEYQWRFKWHFRHGQLLVQPSLGRALIYEPL